jgi:uncharacterized protein YjlB
MVFKGTLLMDFRDGRTVAVNEGEILIVPKGVEHRKPARQGDIMVPRTQFTFINPRTQKETQWALPSHDASKTPYTHS